MNSTSGNGNNVTSTLDFIGPTLTMTVAVGQKIHAVATKALGSTLVGGGVDHLYMCSKLGAAAIVSHGSGVFDLDAAQNSRQLYGLSHVYTGLPAGAHVVGLCGSSTSPATWNHNEYGYISAFVSN